MTIRHPVALASERDNHSFLVPCLGFSDAAAAAIYSTNRDCLTEQRVTGMDDNFATVSCRDKTYVPRISSIHGQWLTSDLLYERSPVDQKRRLRHKSTPRPSADAFNVCLLVSGPRQFAVYYPRTTEHPDWWYQLHMGNRDCFAVWGRDNGQPIDRHDPLDGTNHLTATRSARGVIYARTANFSNKAEPSGFTNILLKMNFWINDKDAAKDDLLVVQTSRSLSITTVEEDAYDFTKSEEDTGWKILVKRAQKGFALHCKTVPEEIDNWRLNIA